MMTKTIEYFKRPQEQDREIDKKYLITAGRRFRILSTNVEDLVIEISAKTICWKGETHSQFRMILAKEFGYKPSTIWDMWRQYRAEKELQEKRKLEKRLKKKIKYFVPIQDYDEACLNFIYCLILITPIKHMNSVLMSNYLSFTVTLPENSQIYPKKKNILERFIEKIQSHLPGYEKSWNLISEKPYQISYSYYIEEGTKTKEELEVLNTSWKTK